MSIKIIKKNGKCYIELPGVFNTLNEVELFPLRGHFWLMSAPLNSKIELNSMGKGTTCSVCIENIKQTVKPFGKKLSPEENAVLQKLLQIKFADRTPLTIERLFSSEEKNIVRQLLKKGWIAIFYGKKYQKTGVYNIRDNIYPLITAITEKKPEKPLLQPIQPKTSVPTYSELAKNGWLVIANPYDAEQFSYELRKSGFVQNVKGVRAFDGKFYLATNKFLYTAHEKIKAILEKEMHLEEIASATKLEVEALLTVLNLLAENGEIIEKRKGLYCLA